MSKPKITEAEVWRRAFVVLAEGCEQAARRYDAKAEGENSEDMSYAVLKGRAAGLREAARLIRESEAQLREGLARKAAP